MKHDGLFDNVPPSTKTLSLYATKKVLKQIGYTGMIPRLGYCITVLEQGKHTIELHHVAKGFWFLTSCFETRCFFE